jgi:hypothetical protein
MLPKVDGFCGQQTIDFRRVRQGKQVESTLVFIISEIVFVDFGVDFHIRERPRQDEEVYRQRILSLGLQCHLKHEKRFRFALDSETLH